MKKYIQPNRAQWPDICQRPYREQVDVESVVSQILADVKASGDDAIKQYNLKFDGIKIPDLKVKTSELKEAENLVSDELKDAIGVAKRNIEAFHTQQTEKPVMVETMEGVVCWRKSIAIEKVGLYIPGGSAPLFSTLLMLAIPAQLAGCREIAVCTPVGKDGKVHPAVLYTASILGITDIFKIGGAQAIAAMTYGTASVPRVYKLFGPGNQYVTMAKQLAQQEGVAIDMPAGPSELLVIADDNANASFVAADLLSQAEHGPDSQVLLVASAQKATEVQKALNKQLAALPRQAIAQKALQNSLMVIMNDLEEAMEFSNMYAPEHLILNTASADLLPEKVINAGSVFIGPYSCESIGDYASGTNHTLPTNYFARNYSGVSVDSFVRKVTFQRVSASGLKNIGSAVETMAEAEALQAHKNAVSVRLKTLGYED